MSDDVLNAWHRPRFREILCATMTDRERLGLPDHYVRDRLADVYPAAFEQVRRLDRSALVALCGDRSAALAPRIAAGNVLACIGDPRIAPQDPAMVAIAGGTVEIGLAPQALDAAMAACDDLGLDAGWIAKEIPRHKVRLAPFAIGLYPVTHFEYRLFLEATGHAELPSSWTFRRFPVERANHPVHSVSVAGARAYCAWLSAETGRAFRLPGEAEWEYAAGGADGREFPWGDVFDCDKANCGETGLFTSTPVGVFPGGASAFGVLDMAGNVEEYVEDLYAPYPGGAFVADHLSDIHGDYNVARGGTFARFRDLARTRRRHGHNPRSSAYAMGFRLAETLEG